jgi:LmbE family N-acetylglucosaminyl deacetylase
MSQDIVSFLKNHKNQKFLAIFPHPDDTSFVAGGLFQLLEKMKIHTKLICLTSVVNKKQLDDSNKVLGIDDTEIYNYEPGTLKTNKSWIERIKKEIENTKPFSVLTFDPYGITGNKDHIDCSIGLLDLFQGIKAKKPILLWRISDMQEKIYFDNKDKGMPNIEATFFHFLRLSESIKKLKAIFIHKNKFKSFMFRLRILEWYLFDHKELYYLVNFGNNKYRFVVN